MSEINPVEQWRENGIIRDPKQSEIDGLNQTLSQARAALITRTEERDTYLDAVKLAEEEGGKARAALLTCKNAFNVLAAEFDELKATALASAEKVVEKVEEYRFAWGCFCSRSSENEHGTTKHTDQCNQVAASLNIYDAGRSNGALARARARAGAREDKMSEINPNECIMKPEDKTIHEWRKEAMLLRSRLADAEKVIEAARGTISIRLAAMSHGLKVNQYDGPEQRLADAIVACAEPVEWHEKP